MNNVNFEARERAERIVRYFERIASDNDAEVWQKGLSTAHEWLRLIDAENASEAELLRFIGVVHANRYRSSGWSDLAGGAYFWVQSQGVRLPSEEDFFEPEIQLGGVYGFYKQTSHEQAQTYLTIFENYLREDPSSRVWKSGLEIARDWLRLINTSDVGKSEAAMLVQKVFENRFLSDVWAWTALGICHWCKQLGHIDLIPDEFRTLLLPGDESVN